MPFVVILTVIWADVGHDSYPAVLIHQFAELRVGPLWDG